MSDNKSVTVNYGPGCFTLMFIASLVLVILNLADVIEVSWWVAFGPLIAWVLWIAFWVLGVVFAIVSVVVVAVIAAVYDVIRR